MNKIVDVLMRRDGLSKDEAIEAYTDFKEEIESMMDDDVSVFEIEEYFVDILGLELEYLDDLLADIVS